MKWWFDDFERLRFYIFYKIFHWHFLCLLLIDNRPPKFSFDFSPRKAIVGEKLSILLKATDPDNRPFSFSLAKPTPTSGVTFDTSAGLFQYQVTSPQNTSFTFQVKDECNATDTVTIRCRIKFSLNCIDFPIRFKMGSTSIDRRFLGSDTAATVLTFLRTKG